jgi:hypothetical protein
MSTAIPGEVWRPTSAEQVLVELGTKGSLTDEHTGGRPKMNAEFGSEWDTLYNKTTPIFVCLSAKMAEVGKDNDDVL